MKPLRIGLSQISQKVGQAFYFPYSVGLLQAYVQSHAPDPLRYQFLPPIYQRLSVPEALAQLQGVDVMGLSLYVWNEQRTLAIAKALKAAQPETLIVVGGPQVPDQAEDFLRQHPFIDLCFHGAGEQPFFQFLEALPDWKAINIPGTSTLQEGDFVHHPPAPRVKDLSVFPSPYLTGVFDPLLETESHWIGMLETNRGCPFRCSFCDWGSAIASKIYPFPIERVEAEIEWLAKNKVLNVFVCDANFGILKRDVDIAQHVSDMKARYGYPKSFQTQTAKNVTTRVIDVSRILTQGGLSASAAISLQSVSDKVLTSIKRDNISLDTYRQLQNFAVESGIFAYTDMIIALPGETLDSFKQGISTVINNGQHSRILFHDATILPNAEMADPEYRVQYGIETAVVNLPGHTPLEDGIPELMEIIIATRDMPREDWVQAHVFAWMTNFLYYNHKLLQPTLMVLHHVLEQDYHALIQYFMDVKGYPILSQLQAGFTQMAKVYQAGYSKETQEQLGWTPIDGVYLPPDILFQIKLVNAQLILPFYAEIQAALTHLAHQIPDKLPMDLVPELIAFNANLFLQHMQGQQFPFPMQPLPPPVPYQARYNVEHFFRAVLQGHTEDLVLKAS